MSKALSYSEEARRRLKRGVEIRQRWIVTVKSLKEAGRPQKRSTNDEIE